MGIFKQMMASCLGNILYKLSRAFSAVMAQLILVIDGLYALNDELSLSFHVYHSLIVKLFLSSWSYECLLLCCLNYYQKLQFL
jgi:hypothetical protein